MEHLAPFNWPLGLVASRLPCGVVGGYRAPRKGRGQAEWFCLAFLFGPIALVALACLPDGETRPDSDRPGDGRADGAVADPGGEHRGNHRSPSPRALSRDPLPSRKIRT
jgi:hypothetical protein